jgi:hypothetical protein
MFNQDTMIAVDRKPKLPKHLSYPLKTSALEEALRDAGVEPDVSLHYWTPQTGHSVLLALLWPPNENVDHVRVYIRAGVVPAKNEERPHQRSNKRHFRHSSPGWFNI